MSSLISISPDLRHPEDRESVVASIHAAIEGGKEDWSHEYRYVRADGSSARVHDRGRGGRDSPGKAYRMVRGMTDISERKKIEAQFLRAQRMESIGTLASGIARDPNNMLSPILMSIELLRQQAGDLMSQKLLATIEKSAGGFINIYSEPGRGATFKIYLLADPQTSTSETTSTPPRLPRGPGETISLRRRRGLDPRDHGPPSRSLRLSGIEGQ